MSDSTQIVLDKCCTILRICVDNSNYMPDMKAEFEEVLKPVFQLIVNPKAISFDDDIVVLIKSFVKKSKEISPVMWELFDLLPNVVQKNKGELVDLLDTINYFMVYGKEQFAQREMSIRVMAEIIKQAMFTRKILSDCEGAILCQLLMQTLAGTQALDALLQPLLALTSQRMKEDPDPIELKKHLIGIFMASMYYNVTLTMQFLEECGLTAVLVDLMINVREVFTHEYERKFYIIGLSRMLMSPQLPASLQPRLVTMLNSIVSTISQLHDQVTKRVEAQARKEAKIEDESDEESDDDEDSDEEEVQKPKKHKADEESKTETTMQEEELGFTEKHEKDENADDGDEKSDNEDIDVDDDAEGNASESDNDFEPVSYQVFKVNDSFIG